MSNVKIEDGILLCPVCGSSYLHQSKVTVFSREEDQENTIKVTVKDKKCMTQITNRDNPSPRRQGLEIKFQCEQCTEFPWLNIYQHEGNTYINWNT